LEQQQFINMVQLITQGIKVSIETTFEGSFYKYQKMNYAFGYTVTIENNGKETIQLTDRHWDIKDSLNVSEIVEGEGVIGNKPILAPGERHRYSSGCMLQSPFGAMKGFYNMLNLENGNRFKVGIPSFRLSATFAMN